MEQPQQRPPISATHVQPPCSHLTDSTLSIDAKIANSSMIRDMQRNASIVSTHLAIVPRPSPLTTAEQELWQNLPGFLLN